MEILIKVTQLILSLSILIILHELGHFIPAKLFKTRVEKFYLFFDPWFSLFKIKRKDTEYGIGWIPLGGYCKISGMIDESMDKEQLKKPPQPWEFRSKSVWKRLIILVGGVTMNLILAIIIYIFLLFLYGEQYLPTKNVKYGIACDSLALELGLKNGDKILSLDNKYVDNFNKIPIELLYAKTIQLERDGNKLEIPVKKEVTDKLLKLRKSIGFISYRYPFYINGFLKNSEAKKYGLKIGDKLVGINGVKAEYVNEFRTEIIKLKNKETEIIALRNKDTLRYKVKISKDGTIGVEIKSADTFFTLNTQTYSFIESIPAGIKKTFETTYDYVKSFKIIFTRKTALESVGGFIAIGNIFSSQWDWVHFWSLTAFLSVMLAFLNILPVPGLDGGHVLFVLYEIITGKKPSDKFLEYATTAGMIFLLALVLLANGNDVMRLFK
ncbi:MAG: RIP metalloprotease RseP [Bacteroidales bacterium]|jgi:regulator of sigma E protease